MQEQSNAERVWYLEPSVVTLFYLNFVSSIKQS